MYMYEICYVNSFFWTTPFYSCSQCSCLTNQFFYFLISGQYGPGICLIAASYTGCDRVLTITLLTIGVGLNGGIYSGFKINHLDITPRFAGILMSITNCSANLAGLLAPIVAGILIEGKVCIPLPQTSGGMSSNPFFLPFTANNGSMANRLLHRRSRLSVLRYILQRLRFR